MLGQEDGGEDLEENLGVHVQVCRIDFDLLSRSCACALSEFI